MPSVRQRCQLIGMVCNQSGRLGSGSGIMLVYQLDFEKVMSLTRAKIGALAALTLAAAAAYASMDEEIAQRISKVGSVCIEGEDCGAAAPVATKLAAAGSDIAANYNMTCGTCHNVGVAGAPKRGDAEAWAPRLEKGLEALYLSAINGMPPAMPAKGLCFACSDDELKALVDYMLEPAE